MASALVLRLQADLAAARLREERLQQAWSEATYTADSRDPDALAVELARVQAEVAELEERHAELAGAPALAGPQAPAPAPAAPALPEYLDTRQAAALLGVSTDTLERWRTQGKGPPFIRPGGGRVIRYPLAELRKFAVR